MRDVLPEGGRVKCIAEFEEGGETRERGIVEAVEVSEIAGLVDLVDICLLGREVEMFLDFLADACEEGWVYETLDDTVLVSATTFFSIL